MDNIALLKRADDMLRGLPSDFRLTPDQSENFMKLLTMTGPFLKRRKLVWMPVDAEAVERFKAATTSWFHRTCILAHMAQMRQHKVFRFLRYGYGSATVKGRILKACEEHGVPLESLALRPDEPTPRKCPGLARELSPGAEA